MTNSPGSDLLIRIKNAYLAGNYSTSCPFSGLCLNIVTLLKKNNYISDFSTTDEVKKKILITLNPADGRQITFVRIISRPGCRIYTNSSKIPWGKTANSLIIISTSSGVMSQKEAVSRKLGGELIAEVY
jgi:small subunit ribosomal protein S8